MLIRCSARCTAGNGLLRKLSERGGGGGSSLSTGTGENFEGDTSLCSKELPYALNNALTTSCREEGAVSPKPCGAATLFIVGSKRCVLSESAKFLCRA